MVEALVVGSLHAIRLYCTVVIVAEVAIVDCSVVCVHHALRGRLLLIGKVLGAIGPPVPCRFIWEEVDGAQYLVVAPGLFIA